MTITGIIREPNAVMIHTIMASIRISQICSRLLVIVPILGGMLLTSTRLVAAVDLSAIPIPPIITIDEAQKLVKF